MISPTLETERLWLRLLEPGDAAAITQYAGDRRVAATTLNIPHPYSIDMAHQFIAGTRQAAAAGDSFTFAMTRKPQRQLIGVIDLRPQQGHSAEVGYWTGVPWWGQGYMSEALRAIIRHAFRDLGLQRVYASHFASNLASGRVMQKAGMSYEGCLRQHVIRWNEAHDLVYYGILRAEFCAG